jgi:hypothetical protein
MIMNTTAIMTTIMITITTRGSANCSAWHQAGIKTPPRHGYSAILCALRSGHCS